MKNITAALISAFIVFSGSAFADDDFEHTWSESKNGHHIDLIYEGSSYFPGIDASYSVDGSIDSCDLNNVSVKNDKSLAVCNNVVVSLYTEKDQESGCYYYNFQYLKVNVGNVSFVKKVGAAQLYRNYIKCPDNQRF